MFSSESTSLLTAAIRIMYPVCNVAYYALSVSSRFHVFPWALFPLAFLSFPRVKNAFKFFKYEIQIFHSFFPLFFCLKNIFTLISLWYNMSVCLRLCANVLLRFSCLAPVRLWKGILWKLFSICCHLFAHRFVFILFYRIIWLRFGIQFIGKRVEMNSRKKKTKKIFYYCW